jgi:hypothetical protein
VAALEAWVADPSRPLDALEPAPATPSQMVQVQTCAACGTAAVKGFLSINGASAGYTRAIPLPAGGPTAAELGRATGVRIEG